MEDFRPIESRVYHIAAYWSLLSAAIGLSSSTAPPSHTRARGLFFYLKSGQVDYGEEHSKTCGIPNLEGHTNKVLAGFSQTWARFLVVDFWWVTHEPVIFTETVYLPFWLGGVRLCTSYPHRTSFETLVGLGWIWFGFCSQMSLL